MSLTPAQFVRLLDERGAPSGAQLRYATIPANYTSGAPQLIFDGETAATTRTWPRLASYTPAANDRVAVLMIGGNGIILGKVTS